MAYTAEDAKKTIDNIINNKYNWQIANNVKHRINGMYATDYYKNEAKKDYDALRANGYGTVANQLQNSNYDQAKKWAKDYYTKTGRSQFRPFMYEQAKAFGLGKDYVDNQTRFDDTTGEVIFGGKNIGKPAGIADGASYFDPEYLKDVWNEHVKDSGISRSDEQLAGINKEEIRNKANTIFDTSLADRELMIGERGKLGDYIYDHNPYDTEIGKAIMADYQLKGENASRSEIADGAGSNGGNIDSFAAANAKRQQLAFTNAGKQAVLNDFNSRIAHAKDNLAALGVDLQNSQDNMYRITALQQAEAQRLFENTEARKDNETARLREQATVSGYTPIQWTLQNDPLYRGFVDENGKLKAEYKNTDFQALADAAKARGDEKTANKYAVLRGLKFRDYWDEFKQHAGTGDVAYLEPERIADFELTNKQIDTDKEVALDTNAKNLEGVKYSTDAQERISTATNKGSGSSGSTHTNISVKKNNVQSAGNSALTGQNKSSYYHSGSSSSTSSSKAKTDSGTSSTGSSNKSTLTTSQAIAALKNGEISDVILSVYNSAHGTNYTIDNPPSIYKAPENNSGAVGKTGVSAEPPVSEKEVKKWADYLNDYWKENYGEGTVIKKTGVNSYAPGAVGSNEAIELILNSDLSSEEARYLLLDKFKFTEEGVYRVMNKQ